MRLEIEHGCPPFVREPLLRTLRLTEDDLSTLEFMAACAGAKAAMARGGTHDASDPWRLSPPRHMYMGYAPESCPEAAAYLELRGPLGLDLDTPDDLLDAETAGLGGAVIEAP